jgi:hypothetical protein
VEDAARTEILLICEILLSRIIELLGLFLGVQVIQVAEPFVEAMYSGDELVAVTKMVLAELSGGVSLRLQDLGKSGVGFLDAPCRPRNPPTVRG